MFRSISGRISASLLLSLPLAAQAEKLNLPLPLNPAAAGSGVGFGLTPDDKYVLYSAREASDARAELRSWPMDGSGPALRLTGALPVDEGAPRQFWSSPDGRRIFFLTYKEEETDDSFSSSFQLYFVPVDASAIPRRLAVIEDQPLTIAVSPDGTWLVYEFWYEWSYVLYSVPADGHRDPVRLVTTEQSSMFFAGIGDGRVLYQQRVPAGTGMELYSIDFDGSDRVRLAGDLVTGGPVPNHAISPDGQRVVYRTDPVTPGLIELFSVSVHGGTPVRLNGPMIASGDVLNLDISPDSTRVAYRATQDSAGVREVYVAPIDGTGAPVKVSGALTTARDVDNGPRFSPDSQRVVYRADALTADQFQLFSAPADASAAPTLVSGSMVTGGDVGAFLLTDGHAVYDSDAEVNDRGELYSAPIDGSALPIRLTAMPSAGDVRGFWLSADGSHAFFSADALVDQSMDLFAVPVSGAQAPSRMNEIARPMDLPFTFRSSADGAWVFLVEAGDLRRRPSDGSAPAVVVNGSLSPGDRQGDVDTFQQAPDGGRLIYRADQDVDERDVLVSVRTDGPLEHVRLSDPLQTSNSIHDALVCGGHLLYLRPSPTDQRVLTVPVDRAQEPVDLTSAFVRPFVKSRLLSTPDRSRVAFVAREDGGQFGLYSAPVDGSALATKLSGVLVQYGRVEDNVGFTPDGSRAVYRADAEQLGRTELYSAPIDGSAPPVKISGTLVAGGEVIAAHDMDAPLVTPDGRLALYRADANVDERFELFAAPIDASAAPVKLSGVLVRGGDVQSGFALSPDGELVVYRADARVDEVFELFSVALDGSAQPVRLGPGLADDRDVLEVGFSPDGERVLFRAGQVDEVVGLYSVSLEDGYTVRLDPSGTTGGNVLRFRIDPGGRRVVYLTDALEDERFELFSSPLDGSSPAVRLSRSSLKGGDVQYFGFSPDGTHVAYLADHEVDGVNELYYVPTDGSRPATRKNDPLVPGGEVTFQFQISADGGSLYYIADQEENDVFELYRVSLENPVRPVRPVRLR